MAILLKNYNSQISRSRIMFPTIMWFVVVIVAYYSPVFRKTNPLLLSEQAKNQQILDR